MKLDTMRRIDRWLGDPLCHLLAPLSRLFARPARPGTVVVCKFFGLGSVVLAHPLVAALKSNGHEVTFVTFAGNRDLLGGYGVGEVLTIDPSSAGSFIRDTFKCIVRLRRWRPAAFLNLEFFSRYAALISLFSGATVRAGFHMLHLPLGKLQTHRSNLNVYRPVHENFLNLGQITDLIGEPGSIADHVEAFRAAAPTTSTDRIAPPYIVISPETSEANGELRRWPSPAWAGLLAGLAETYPGYRLVIIGTNADRRRIDEILDHQTGPLPITDLTGETSIAELQGLIRNAALLITLDSAPLHFGVFLKTPTVALFGPETPALFGHRTASVRIIYKDLFCSPCSALYDAKACVLDCRDNQCMKQISVAEVLAAATDLLPRQGSETPAKSIQPSGGAHPHPASPIKGEG